MLLAIAVSILIFWAFGERFMKGEKINLILVIISILMAISYFYGKR